MEQENYFKNQRLREACDMVLAHPDYQGETHHAELEDRYLEAGASQDIAAIAATIQSGYYPRWVKRKLSEKEDTEMTKHVIEVSNMPNSQNSNWGGWNYPW